MDLSIVNNSGQYKDSEVFLGFIGQTTSGEWGALALTEGGNLGFTPDSSGTPVPFYVLSDLGASVSIEDYVISGRIYVSVGQELSLSTPTSGAPFLSSRDDVIFDYFEYTYDLGGGGVSFCNADVTPVDMVGIPMSFELVGETTAGPLGFNTMRSEIFETFDANATFKSLILKDSNGVDLRILAPGHGIENGVLSAAYLEAYIDTVWAHYTATQETLTLNPTFVDGTAYTSIGVMSDDVFTFTTTPGGGTHTINKPTSKDVFLCNGVFNGTGSQTDFTIDADIKNQVASALNRGILPLAKGAKLCNSSNFYATTTYNKGAFNTYAQLLHELSYDGLSYGFAYDDQCNQSCDVSVNSPSALAITILSFGES